MKRSEIRRALKEIGTELDKIQICLSYNEINPKIWAKESEEAHKTLDNVKALCDYIFDNGDEDLIKQLQIIRNKNSNIIDNFPFRYISIEQTRVLQLLFEIDLEICTLSNDIIRESHQTDSQLSDLLKDELKTDKALTIFQKAINFGMIEMTDTGLIWKGGKDSLLSYMCGKIYCGDTSWFDPVAKGYHIELTNKRFPDRKLNNLFGLKDLGQKRLNLRDYKFLPPGHEKVDKLFEGVE